MQKADDHDDNYYEAKLNELFEKIKNDLTKEDREEINDLIIHGEGIVAYEMLCNQLYEYSTPISVEAYDIIVEIGHYIEYKDSDLNLLKTLVKE